MERHPEISLRKPEATSVQRATGFNQPRVMEFFDLLEKIIEKENLTPQRIYNMDETGLSTVQKPQKILGRRGKHQIGAATKGKRSVVVPLLCHRYICIRYAHLQKDLHEGKS